MSISKTLTKHKHTILYGLTLAILLLFLKWIEFNLIVINHTFEIYMGVLALFFTALGIWLAVKITKPQNVVIEKPIYINNSTIDVEEIARLNLSKRELEVLQLMAAGFSNQEISDKLFVSLNTIKTHSAKLFEKMEVKRRTQAIEMAKRLGIII